jgi:hypothetical protein
MIQDPATMASVREGWEFVCWSRVVIVGQLNNATNVVGFNKGTLGDICFTLLLATGMSVVEDVLIALRNEGHFMCRSTALGQLMHESKAALPWQDFATIDRAREKRNEAIHERHLMNWGECRDFLVAIERELVGWGIVVASEPNFWHFPWPPPDWTSKKGPPPPDNIAHPS